MMKQLTLTLQKKSLIYGEMTTAVQTTLDKLEEMIQSADWAGSGAFHEVVEETKRFLSPYEVDYETPKLKPKKVSERPGNRMQCGLQCRYGC